MKFDFRKPYKIRFSSLRDDRQNYKRGAQPNYERYSWCETKYGIVTLEQLDWELNSGRDKFTFISTIIEGIKYSAFISKSRLSDQQIKWFATNFIKKAIQLHQQNKNS